MMIKHEVCGAAFEFNGKETTLLAKHLHLPGIPA